MISEELSQIRSPVHSIDPRFRIGTAFGFALLVAVSFRYQLLLPALAVSLGLAGGARLPVTAVLRRLMVVNGFILFLWLFLPFTTPGSPFLHIGPLQATIEGIALAGIVTLKANAIVLAILALIGTMPVAVLGHGLQRLHVPAKICHLLLFTYRYIFIIEQEYGKLITAMKIRGFVPGTDMHTYRSYANLLGMLLVRSLDRAERIYQAMLCRGFQGNFVSLATFSSRPRDYLFGLIMLLVLCGLLLLGTG